MEKVSKAAGAHLRDLKRKDFEASILPASKVARSGAEKEQIVRKPD